MIKFRMDGLRELEDLLMELSKPAAKASSRRILKKAGKPMAEAGARNAPEDQGHLKESYGVGTKLTKRQRRQHVKQSEVEVFVGPNDPSAVQTEFGNEHQAAQPHLRPAFEAKKHEALRFIGSEFMADIQKTIARQKRRLAKKKAK